MSINLNILQQPKVRLPETNFDPVFTDLHLDLKVEYTLHDELHRKPERKDIVLDYDLGAIKNSLSNIFSTLPGQKLLNPMFGCDFRRFLFEPISEARASLIGRTILYAINNYEPRISVTNINVYPDEENNQYIIDISYNIPNVIDKTHSTFNFHTSLSKI